MSRQPDMPETPTIEAPPPESNARRPLARVRSPRQRSLFGLGLPEIIALFASALLLFAAISAYLFMLGPARSRLTNMQAERQRLEMELQQAKQLTEENRGAQMSVQSILGSLQDFETRHLSPSAGGQLTIIRELNRLLGRNGLRISGGVSYTQLQETTPGSENQRRNSNRQGEGRVEQSIFPGIQITLTVEGPYANLRRFIRDVEAEDRHFVVINAVELEGITDSGAPSVAPAPGVTTAARPSPGGRGTLVSLRLELAAYFRRGSFTGEQIPLGATGEAR